MKGYEVFRAGSHDGAYENASGTVPNTAWTDTNVVDGGIYFYKLRAVDVSGNYSGFSAPSEAAVIRTSGCPSGGPITVISPNGGESYFAGALFPHHIRWLKTSATGRLVRIELLKGGANVHTIALLAPNNGDYAVRIPGTLAPGNDYQIRITSLLNASYSDTSDTYFTVRTQTSAQSAGQTRMTDNSPPYVALLETYPRDGQGIDEDTNGNGILDSGEDLDGDAELDQDDGPTPRVPRDTAVMIRTADDTGIDETTIELNIDGARVYPFIRRLESGDSREIDIVYRNPEGFAFNHIITVELRLSDLAGNHTEFVESFRIESETEYLWAAENAPVQTITEMGDGTCEVEITPEPDAVNDEPLDGARIVFMCNEIVEPRFGPLDEFPSLDIGQAIGISINIEPPNVFENPISLIIPLPEGGQIEPYGDGATDTETEEYKVYYYKGQPTELWENISDTHGVLSKGPLTEHDANKALTLKVNVTRSGGFHVGF
ncbi:hypothetical protein HZA56_10785 [Candidatus Poribacteria bacterium]|nr:hypothetical protein [Candidatus Poribacteria bacterium]